MSAFDGVSEGLKSFLDAFEKGIIFGGAGSGTFVWVMTEDFLAVCAFDLGVSRSITMFGEAKNSVMILSLRELSAGVIHNREVWEQESQKPAKYCLRMLKGWQSRSRLQGGQYTFQSLASLPSINGSSGSLISSASSSSTFLTFSCA